MTHVGLVRVTTDAVDVARQHAALRALCCQVFAEPASRRRVIENRPALQAALDRMSPEDILVVQKVGRLGQTMFDGMEVLTDLVDRGVVVKVLDGALAGEHADRSFVLDQCLEISALQRQIRRSHAQEGIAAAREHGAVHGRPRVVDADKRARILFRFERGDTLRSIARSADVSVGTVHNVVRRDDRSGIIDTPQTLEGPC